MSSQFLQNFPYSQTSYTFAWYLYSYIFFIDQAMFNIPLWQSFKEVNFAPKIFPLLEPYTENIIQSTYQFFKKYSLSSHPDEQEILTFWRQEVNHLFAPEYGDNLYGYVLAHLSLAHWDFTLDEKEQFLFPNQDLPLLINGYLQKRQLPQQSFWDTEKARLKLEYVFRQWKEILYIHQQKNQEATMTEIISTVFPSYLESWEQACYWQHASDMHRYLRQIQTNLYQKYHLQILKDFWVHHTPKSLHTNLSQKEFTHIFHNIYLEMYYYLNTNPSQTQLKFHMNKKIIALEEHMPYLLAYRLISTICQYIDGMYSLEDELHSLPQEIQDDVPQNALNTRFITMSKHLYHSLI